MTARKAASKATGDTLVVRYRDNGGPWQARWSIPANMEGAEFTARRRAKTLEGPGRTVVITRYPQEGPTP